ncbi:MAG: hypothetical protein KJ556_12430 [Gammaproteobacteria bacterium]|nr:hypothetical protein [Gammaproteobacteria bacterium]MBU2059441.1 hypothetical protein [Gammaproteobacteria bacterium]MBU2175928.1 hypothetical protein [Gammaproteobacteria bacterium]MBU2246342.1 hypothetical protein [Gammaproteobacteria bacterium]MBU2392887.1 hypothetical protein [Gammaproteobacteria bacterium]
MATTFIVTVSLIATIRAENQIKDELKCPFLPGAVPLFFKNNVQLPHSKQQDE